MALQGFCCACQSGAASDDGVATRAGRLCDWQTYYPGSSEMSRRLSAHCMRLNNVWWEMHSIGSTETDFELVVAVDTSLASEPAATGRASEITLSQHQPTATASDLPLSAAIQGLTSYFPFPTLTSSKAIVRKAPGALFSLTKDDLMVLADSMVSVSGWECNKVGTFFGAFRCAAALLCAPIALLSYVCTMLC